MNAKANCQKQLIYYKFFGQFGNFDKCQIDFFHESGIFELNVGSLQNQLTIMRFALKFQAKKSNIFEIRERIFIF